MQQDTALKATNTINSLKEVYMKDIRCFDFYVSQYISGDGNKGLRQEIVKQLTGEDKPKSKCGMYAVSDTLRNSFTQYSLFN